MAITEYDREPAPSGRNAGRKDRQADANLDPITGAPGAHPVGTGVGAAAGGLAGAAAGSLGGPVGTAVGAAAGAITGGLAGKRAGEAVNPTAEEAFWRSAYATRAYVRPGTRYEDLAPAYRYGWESYGAYQPRGLTFDQAEPELRDQWKGRAGDASLDWPGAREAARDAWSRVQERASVRSEARSMGAGAAIEAKGAKEVCNTLNDLIQICNDGAMGFRLAAEKSSPVHASLFHQFAADREAFVGELQEEVRVLGGEPKDSGDATGALHRGWINIKSAITSGDKAIIDECERGEDAAVNAYQSALRTNPPPEIYAVVARQYTKVKNAHDRVSALKHSMI